MSLSNMEKYIDYFSALHTNTQKGVKAPHKAIMLLSVIDLVEYGVITSNQIEFSERLEQQFQHNWSRYVGQSDVFQPRVGTPFWHLNNESFCRDCIYVRGLFRETHKKAIIFRLSLCVERKTRVEPALRACNSRGLLFTPPNP